MPDQKLMRLAQLATGAVLTLEYVYRELHGTRPIPQNFFLLQSFINHKVTSRLLAILDGAKEELQNDSRTP